MRHTSYRYVMAKGTPQRINPTCINCVLIAYDRAWLQCGLQCCVSSTQKLIIRKQFTQQSLAYQHLHNWTVSHPWGFIPGKLNSPQWNTMSTEYFCFSEQSNIVLIFLQQVFIVPTAKFAPCFTTQLYQNLKSHVTCQGNLRLDWSVFKDRQCAAIK